MALQLPPNLEQQIIDLAHSSLRKPSDVLAELITQALEDRRITDERSNAQWGDGHDSVARLLADMKM